VIFCCDEAGPVEMMAAAKARAIYALLRSKFRMTFPSPSTLRVDPSNKIVFQLHIEFNMQFGSSGN
jgi:hypothetical protein